MVDDRRSDNNHSDNSPLDARSAQVLRAVVEQYVETSQPVSSSSVMERGGISASSATVRSEMAALERAGFLQQPHTSAGRIPTDLGYRFFVDQLNDPGRLAIARQQDAQQQEVHDFFDNLLDDASGEIEHMLNETGRLLSKLTSAAAVVVGPNNDAATICSAQIVALGERVGLAVVVLSDGRVHKSQFELPRIDPGSGSGTGPGEVHDASLAFHQLVNGVTLGGLTPEGLGGNSSAIVAAAVKALGETKSKDHSDNVYVGGASQLADAFEAVDVVRNVLTFLEQQFVVVNLMRDLLERGITVSIGNENKATPLAQCSLVVAPAVVDGETRGSVAVLGPTRMDYSQAMAAVAVVGRRLGERLGSN